MTDLAERYGVPSRSRRRVGAAGVGVLATVSLAWLVWAMLAYSRPQVTSQLIGFNVSGPHTATATFTVSRRASDVRASCGLRAISTDLTVVGERGVLVTGRRTDAQMEVSVRTERRATSVDLLGCTAVGQPTPR